MKHSLTINLMVEGDIPQVLEAIRLLDGHIKLIYVPKIEIIGINLYKEHNFEEGPATMGVATKEDPTQSLDEE